MVSPREVQVFRLRQLLEAELGSGEAGAKGIRGGGVRGLDVRAGRLGLVVFERGGHRDWEEGREGERVEERGKEG